MGLAGFLWFPAVLSKSLFQQRVLESMLLFVKFIIKYFPKLSMVPRAWVCAVHPETAHVVV